MASGFGVGAFGIGTFGTSRFGAGAFGVGSTAKFELDFDGSDDDVVFDSAISEAGDWTFASWITPVDVTNTTMLGKDGSSADVINFSTATNLQVKVSPWVRLS